MFLYRALQDAGDRRRDGVLNGVVDMHHEYARPYRELFDHILTTDNQAEAERLLKEIERLLFAHAKKDTKIPAVYGNPMEWLIYVLKIGASIPSIAVNWLSPSVAKDAVDTAEAVHKVVQLVPDKEHRRVYRGLNFFNHFSRERPTARGLHQELRRIFGDLAFTEAELNGFLAES